MQSCFVCTGSCWWVHLKLFLSPLVKCHSYFVAGFEVVFVTGPDFSRVEKLIVWNYDFVAGPWGVVFHALVWDKIAFVACFSRVLLKSTKFECIWQPIKIVCSNGYNHTARRSQTNSESFFKNRVVIGYKLSGDPGRSRCTEIHWACDCLVVSDWLSKENRHLGDILIIPPKTWLN